ncbi:MAG: TonB-dependent receptor, partial [Acidobacteriota bacterium]
NNFLPRYKWRDGHLMGVERYYPRLSADGPLIQDKVFLAQSFQYRMIKTPVPSLPVLQRDQRFESFDSFTRLDARISARNLLSVTVAIFPKKQDFLNLNTFNPKEVTANLHNRGLQTGFQETAVFYNTQTLETTVTYRRYDSDVFGQGSQPMRLQVQGNQGDFFNRQARQTTTTQWTEVYTKLLSDSNGQHVLKFGLDLMNAAFNGSSRSGVVDIYRSDSTLNTRIQYSVPSSQEVHAISIGVFGQDHWRLSDGLALEFGLRMDRDGVLEKFNLAPRMGAVFSLLPEGRAVVRGGAGLFYDQTPMNVAAFTSYEIQTITRFAIDGIAPMGAPDAWQQRSNADLHTPYSLIWNLEYDHRLSSRWTARLDYMRRYGHHEYLVDPIISPSAPEYFLDSRGRSKYREVELTVRYSRHENFNMSWSYVHSHSEADLNSYDLFFGNLRDPIIRPNQYSLTSIDAPNRLLYRTVVPLPLKFTFSSMVEARSGFPYSAFDESRQYVGPRNRAGRFPSIVTLDARVVRLFKVRKYTLEAGVFAFHILNSFAPRDVQANVDAPNYGTFYNTIPRNWGFTFLWRK